MASEENCFKVRRLACRWYFGFYSNVRIRQDW
jgi:hypothetical protein